MTLELEWGGLVPWQDVSGKASPAILDWCKRNQCRRPLLLTGPKTAASEPFQQLLKDLEAGGLAVQPFEAAAYPSISSVSEGVASFHFENRDGVIALGGGTAMDVGKAVAMMAGQNAPLHQLAEIGSGERKPIDRKGVQPLLALPTTPLAIAALNGAAWITDEGGYPMLLRDIVLRPTCALFDQRLQIPSNNPIHQAGIDLIRTLLEGKGIGGNANPVQISRQAAAVFEQHVGAEFVVAQAISIRTGLYLGAALDLLNGESAEVHTIGEAESRMLRDRFASVPAFSAVADILDKLGLSGTVTKRRKGGRRGRYQ